MSVRRVSRPECADLGTAESREWLVTNGRGGYAMGTVAGTLTRSYHGLLIAALKPPVARRLVVAGAQLQVRYGAHTFALATNQWWSGARAPEGWRYVRAFGLVDGVPIWTYTLDDAVLEIAIAMRSGSDETALTWNVVRAAAPLELDVALLLADRDHHGGSLPDPAGFQTSVDGERANVALPSCGRTLHVYVPGGSLTVAGEVWKGFSLAREAERGLDPHADYLHALDAHAVAAPGASGGLVVGLVPAATQPGTIVAEARRRGAVLAAGATSPLLGELAIAADRFIVPAASGGPSRSTIVAGYPWFSDWGRDTMIALPGLLLANDRAELAQQIVRAFVPFVDGGMLPNVFPDAGIAPEYNTVDAALWFVLAARACVAKTADRAFARDVFPALQSVVEHYTAGTRYGIHVDPADGLLAAGVDGLQLTWMDAKVDDRVITPRIGKPVEINALWYAALIALGELATAIGADRARFDRAAERVRGSFARFWNPATGCCFDVIDGPHGADAAVRPNQLFAPALAPELLPSEHARAVVDRCARDLLTPVGLRSLAPDDPAYVGHYNGDRLARDAAYHQGTVWPWLIGPFVRAHVNVYGDRAAARGFLDALADELGGYGIGTLGELFDGDPPHRPCGTIAQAWSVAELIVALGLTA